MMDKDKTYSLPSIEEYVRDLQQGLWDVYAELGYITAEQFDPGAFRGDLVEMVLDAAREFRKDAEYDYDELSAERDALLAHWDAKSGHPLPGRLLPAQSDA